MQSINEIRRSTIHFSKGKNNEELGIFRMRNEYFSDEYKLQQIIQKIYTNENN